MAERFKNLTKNKSSTQVRIMLAMVALLYAGLHPVTYCSRTLSVNNLCSGKLFLERNTVFFNVTLL